MTGTFHIKNFDRLQHYKDRSPPWIKLYNGLLDDYAFAHLPDASKAHLLAIGLLASRYSNKIPLDADWIAKRINATSPVDLAALIKSGFIVPDQECSTLLADSLQVAIPEREEERETEVEKVLPDKSGLSKSQVYSEAFEQFWKAYPTDKNMPKKLAFKQWGKLSPEKQQAALGAMPGFTRYCSENKAWYRPIYADRFLSQEKFEGYASETVVSPEELAERMDRRDRLLKQGKYAPSYQ